MPKLTVPYGVTVLAVFSVVLSLFIGEIVKPPLVDSRESRMLQEECGDPDMPDYAIDVGGETLDVTALQSNVAELEEAPSGCDTTLEPSANHERTGNCLQMERRVLLFILWSSIASKVLGF